MEEENILLNPKDTMKKLWEYIFFYKKKLFLVIALTIISTILSVLTPYLLSYILDYVLGKKFFSVLKYTLLLLSFYMITVIISRITSVVMLKISEEVLSNIRKDLFSSLENLSISFFDKHPKGDIMSRFTSDLEMLEDILSDSLVDLITSILTLIGTLVMMFILNISLSIVTIITVPIFFIVALKIGVKTGNTFKKQQNDIGKLNSYFEEYVTNMKIVKSFNIEENIKKQFDLKNNEVKKDEMNAQFFSNLLVPLNTFISNLGNFLILIVGAFLVLKGDITVGIILAFISYSSMFRSPINTLASTFASIQSALAGAERIFDIMNTSSEIKEAKVTKNIGNIKKISFKNVSFKYEQDFILKDITFSLEKKQSLAIVGKTGSGKTTLISLILRLYDICEGEIFLNETNIKDISFKELYQKVGVILQEPFLFEGTIMDNLLYGNQKSEKEAYKASIETSLDDFIKKLPNGYNFYVEENGANLSVGEKQLIALTRVVLKDPDVLILDEATSSTDLYTEKKVYEAMLKLMKKKTTIVIAHRLKTIRNVDNIMLLENGKIVEYGRHDLLLEKKGKYYKLYMSQFS